MTSERNELHRQHGATLEQLEERNRWAQSLESELDSAHRRVVELQDEFERQQQAGRQVAADYEVKVADLERDIKEKTKWALDTEQRLTAELELKCNELAESVHLLDRAEATVEERTRWAQDLDARLQSANSQLEMIKASRWVKLGRSAGLGPKLD
jgi:DNA repair ATPase RecN